MKRPDRGLREAFAGRAGLSAGSFHGPPECLLERR